MNQQEFQTNELVKAANYRVMKCMDDDLCREDEDIINAYDKLAKTYDDDVATLHLDGPRIASTYLRKYVPNKEAYILDCASGTGKLGVFTKAAGYTNVHGVDCSQLSLDAAESRKVYSKLTKVFITNDVPELETDSYDALISVSCFAPNHFKPDVVNEMCRAVKQGGYVIIIMNTIWLSEWEYKDGKLEAAYEKLIKEGKWTRIETAYIENYIRTDTGVVNVFKIN